MGQTAAAAAAVIVVLVGHVSRRWMRVHRAGVGVAQRAAIGRAAGKGAFMLGMPNTMQAVDGVYVGEAGGVLLVRRVSVAELQEG